MDAKKLYDFTYILTKSYEEAHDRKSMIDGFIKAFLLFFPVKDLKIYLMDEYSFNLKDFTKPWENIVSNSDNDKIKKHFDNFLIQKSQFEIENKTLYFPITKKHKTLGIVEINSRDEISECMDFFEILP